MHTLLGRYLGLSPDLACVEPLVVARRQTQSSGARIAASHEESGDALRKS